VLIDEVDARTENIRRYIAFDLLDDQRADDFTAVSTIAIDLSRSTLSGVLVIALRLTKRKHRNVTTIRLIDIILERFFDLWRQVFGCSVVPKWFTGGNDARSKLVECSDNV
jgi:hypothetical protein